MIPPKTKIKTARAVLAGKLKASDAADELGISVQTVYLWTRKLREHGPDALHGRQGKR